MLVILTLGYAAVLAVLAFVVWDSGSDSPWYWPLISFVPAGFLLQLALGPRRWWAAIGFGVLGAAWIEAAQAIWMPLGYGRVEDAIFGSAGAALGVGLGALLLHATRVHDPLSFATEGHGDSGEPH